jgi:hypothetical protein
VQLRCGTPNIRVNTVAIYAVSVSSNPRSKGFFLFLARLSPHRGYQVPSSRPAAQRNRSSANHSAQGEKKIKKWCNSGALFALLQLRFCMLALLCMLSR